jgi:hypothetical protein
MPDNQLHNDSEHKWEEPKSQILVDRAKEFGIPVDLIQIPSSLHFHPDSFTLSWPRLGTDPVLFLDELNAGGGPRG